MAGRNSSIRIALLAGSMLAPAIPATAADVTPDRLVNADKEPGNWLMNHRTYDAQRYSPLDKINTGNVKNLKLLTRSRSAAPRRTRIWKQRRLPRTASSTSPTNGACYTRSTRGPGKRAASCGAWTRGRKRLLPRIAALRCGAAWSSRLRIIRRA
jgi:hypothetical protein